MQQNGMQFLASLVSLLLVLYSVRAAAVLPVEERNLVHSRELSKERKELILKLISGLLDGVDNSVLAGEIAPAPLEVEEPLESRLDERAVYNRLSQLPQRDRKAPCKNFFWKTFTSC
ncbi:cortistatin isoform X1 [Myxocyprinus asiaticus]|uniref:cortistatin isoform X1 n=2 Tax=Myxocyprinus asiaticus TaxID=70543 RepID=UPI0022212C11|nr:cortistatin isoform X1 [Myxocyprinus asiaticus]